MKLVTAVALIFLGIMLPVWFMQAALFQAELDSRRPGHALMARIGR